MPPLFITHWVQLMLPNLQMGIGQSAGVWSTYQGPYSERKQTNSYQQSLAHVPIPHQVVMLAGLLSYRQHEIAWVYEFNSLIMYRRHCLPDVSFVSEHSEDTYSLHSGQLWVSVFTTVHKEASLIRTKSCTPPRLSFQSTWCCTWGFSDSQRDGEAVRGF